MWNNESCACWLILSLLSGGLCPHSHPALTNPLHDSPPSGQSRHHPSMVSVGRSLVIFQGVGIFCGPLLLGPSGWGREVERQSSALAPIGCGTSLPSLVAVTFKGVKISSLFFPFAPTKGLPRVYELDCFFHVGSSNGNKRPSFQD